MPEPASAAVPFDRGIEDLAAWLTAGTPPFTDPVKVIEALGERILAAGIAVDRFGIFAATLHPSVFGRRFLWQPDTGVDVAEAPFATADNPTFRGSPVGRVFVEGRDFRMRFDGGPPEAGEHSVLAELREEGYTDYLVQPLPFTDGSTHAVLWGTRKPGGFSDPEIAGFDRLRLPLARLAEVYALKRVARNLLDTYVGERAGQRILAGQIHRGDVEVIEAAIWLSDLRGFTELADTLPGDQLIDILNRHFDCLVPQIRSHGGEVLKFMGDGLLAIFPLDDGRTAGDRCRAALAAATGARDAMATLNAERAATGRGRLDCGIALHVGKIHYGNIGGSNRLDFTAIGPAVNLAARIENIAADSGRRIVMSDAFRMAARVEADFLGEHRVKGFARPVAVYGIAVPPSTAVAE